MARGVRHQRGSDLLPEGGVGGRRADRGSGIDVQRLEPAGRSSSPRPSRSVRAVRGVGLHGLESSASGGGDRRGRSTTGSSAERFAELEPVGRPIQQGLRDRRSHGHASGERVEQASREDYLYFVGSAEVGEKLDVELVGGGRRDPEGVGFAARAVRRGAGRHHGITALVKDVKARRLPEVDDAFANRLGVRHDPAAPRRPPRAAHRGEGARGDRLRPRPRARGADDPGVDVDLPESLVDEETDHRIRHAGAGRAAWAFPRADAGGAGVGRGAAARRPRARDPGDERPRLEAVARSASWRESGRGDRRRDRGPGAGLRAGSQVGREGSSAPVRS